MGGRGQERVSRGFLRRSCALADAPPCALAWAVRRSPLSRRPTRQGRSPAMLSKPLAHLRRQWMGALALSLVLTGGTAYAATGGNFILGNPNSADATTGLSSNVATGPTLGVTNTGGQPAASFTGGTNAAPFAVNSTKKVAKLNA